MRICALIPAFDEASHIAAVVAGASRFVDLVVVIDDAAVLVVDHVNAAGT